MSDTILVTNISKALSEENIRELFNCVGRITNLQWKDLESEYNCTIAFESSSCVKAAVLLSGTPLGDRPLKVVETTPSSVLSGISGTLSSKRIMTPAETIANLNAAAQKLDPNSSKMTEAQKREEELIARTVYIGNLAPQLTENEVRIFFNQCGNIIYIKMAGNPAMGIKYAFLEFDCEFSAKKAISLTGSGASLADRPVKVGPAMNSIVKPANVAANSDPSRIETAMSRAMRAKERLEERKVRQTSSDKSRRKRSRSHSRHRKRRRSRSGSKSRGKKHDKSKSKQYDVYIPRFKNPAVRIPRAANRIHDGLVWDGFQWTQPSTDTIRQKSENLATKIMDVISSDQTQINPTSQQAMVQQAHQQAALLKAHVEKSKY